MDNEKSNETVKEKEPVNPFNWLIGFDFFFAIAILLASAVGYIVLK